jgi:predicted enzyme related to lactoylglutathione lyase
MPVSHAPIIKGIDITTYTAKDGPRAKAFYRDVMGLEPTIDYGPSGAEFTLGDGSTFGIWQMDDGSFTPASGVMFGVDDITTAVETLTARGVQFAEGGRIEDTPMCRMAFATDTEGNSFIVHQRK